MDNFSVVNVFDGQTDLHEPRHDGRLGEQAAVLRLDPPGQIAAVRELHHDVQHLATNLVTGWQA